MVVDQVETKITYSIYDKLCAIDNICLIEGPNNTGKSTLLHIIAMSLYALELGKGKIPKELLSKIEWLSNSTSKTHIQFELSMSIDNLEFKAKKLLNSKQIERTINNNPIVFEDFKNQFDLIYDIPTNPITRLDEILRSTKSIISDYLKNIKTHSDTIGDILLSIKNDPKTQAEKAENNITNLKEAKKTLGVSLEKLEEKEKKLSDLLLINNKENLEKIIKENVKIRKGLRNDIKEDRKSSSLQNTILENITEINKNIITARDHYFELISNLDLVNNKTIEIGKKRIMNLDVIEDYRKNKGNKYWDLILDINTVIQDIDEEIVDEGKASSITWLKQLKSYLDGLPSNLDNENFTTPIKVLIDEIDKYVGKFSDEELKLEFQKIYNQYSIIDEIHDKAFKIYGQYKKLPKDQQSQLDHQEAKIRIKDLTETIKKDNERLDFIKAEFTVRHLDSMENQDVYIASIKHDYPEFAKREISQLEHLKKDLVGQIIEKGERISDHKARIKINEDLLKKANKQKTSKYSDHEELLEKTQSKLEGLKELFGSIIPEYIDKLLDRRSTDSVDEVRFRQDIENFLASKIPIIPIEEDDRVNQYKVDHIDFLNELFVTEEGREVEFRSYGSGRTSSLSLLSRINNLNPNKISVLLLDEALMDDVSIKPLKGAIKKLYEENKLLAGLLVRYNKEFNVESLLLSNE